MKFNNNFQFSIIFKYKINNILKTLKINFNFKSIN